MREDGHFLAAQPWGTAPRADGETYVLGAEPLTAAPQEYPELLFVHTASVRATRRRTVVLVVPVSARRPTGRCCHDEHHEHHEHY
ncbi:hypothetical protein GCM10010385_60810 [Streptomyces geysiriensis]|nr:hypothetical protein GCM10010385_60810 [Streptomyces geysiriensis]